MQMHYLYTIINNNKDKNKSQCSQYQKSRIMKTTSKYNRSEIMKDAWNLYRISIWKGDFRMCLKKSWEFAKNEINSKPVTFSERAAKANNVTHINLSFGPKRTFEESVKNIRVSNRLLDRKIYKYR